MLKVVQVEAILASEAGMVEAAGETLRPPPMLLVETAVVLLMAVVLLLFLRLQTLLQVPLYACCPLAERPSPHREAAKRKRAAVGPTPEARGSL